VVSARSVNTAATEFYILAPEVPVLERTFVLKHDDTFGLFNDFGDIAAGAQALHIYRSKLIWGAVCYEHIHVRNFTRTPLDVSLSLEFAPISPTSSRCAARSAGKPGAHGKLDVAMLS
jgi:hypothetical protein